MSVDTRHTIIFREIIGAHSPKVITGKIKAALYVIERSLSGNNLDGLKIGANLLNQAIERYELLEKAAELASLNHEHQ